MYYPHFGLKEPPFKITPNTDFFFSGGNRGAVLDALVYAITNGEGIIKVVGEVGSGKTMLCRMLQTILPEKIESIYLANPSVAPEDVLHAIAFELQLKLPKNADRLKVMQQLQAHLLARHAEGRQVVIFVEEAQGMPLATLEEIRLLSNLETKQDKLLQIVLFGQPELDVNLNQTHIRQLRERITHSFHLGPLQTKDVGEYLIFRLRAAGYHGPHLFSDAAIKKLSKAAEGLVRRVNILADKALLAAFADNVYLVTPKHVKAAIHDSEFGAKANNYKNPILWITAAILLVIGILIVSMTIKQNRPDQKILAQAPVITAPAVTQKKIDKPSVDKPIQPVVVDSPNKQEQSLVNKRLEYTKNWLFSGQPNTVTLQIKSLPTTNVVQETQLQAELEKIAQQLEVDNLYLYRKNQNGEIYTVILYGAFAQRSEALDALNKLPSQIQSNHPYLRTIGGINKDIQQAQ
ncbi:MAG TPA: AAA family ATPase [Methylotenera sp.]|nr:AAA family ATPase [Methylotenera sp.]